jgi:hypothetical protein
MKYFFFVRGRETATVFVETYPTFKDALEAKRDTERLTGLDVWLLVHCPQFPSRMVNQFVSASVRLSVFFFVGARTLSAVLLMAA